jgi:2-C-methyl-D-erythritol 4-phosphate cytidylyltransferase
MSILAIIPAAGVGVRMGGSTPKQFLALENVPVFIHTLRKFVACDEITDIYLALRREDMDRARTDVDRERFSKPVRLLEGGDSRQETVAKALAEAPPSTELVLVHDAVRPFIRVEMIRRVIERTREDGAVILAIPSVDTVKLVEHHSITATLTRERVALAQTPQAFRFELLREAFARAEADGFHATDEASLVEHLGHSVTVIMGSDRNIKITKPSDLPLARLYIQEERGTPVGSQQ